MATANQVEFSHISVREHLNNTPMPCSRLADFVRAVDPTWWKYILVGTDSLLILTAFIISYIVRYNLQWFRTVDPEFEVGIQSYIPYALALIVILPLSYRLSGVYPYKRGRGLLEETYAIGTATTAGVVVLIVISLTIQPNLYSRLLFLYTAFLVTVLLGINRFGIGLINQYLRTYGVGVERILLVGAGDLGRIVMRNIVAQPELGYQLVGYLDNNPATSNLDVGSVKALGSTDDLNKVLSDSSIDRVIICLPWQFYRRIQNLLRVCEQLNIRAQVVPDLFQMTRSQMEVEQLNGIPLISTRDVLIQGWNLFFKRVYETIFVGISTVAMLPIILIIAIAIRLDSPGPIIYSQIRVGKNGKPFRCYKFRTMIEGAEELREQISDLNEAVGPLFKVRDDPRLTLVGRFLRRHSLDELPQFYNVLRGDMALVGPRPNLPDEVAKYQEWHKKRLSANPGITGLWQVSGRSDLTFDEMVLLDIYYVENWSMWLDFSILLRTIPAMLQGRGAY